MRSHEGSGPEPRRGEALADQAIVGDGHSCPGNAEPRRELARRRQNIAAAQSPVEDRSPDLAVDLSRQVSPAASG